MCNSCIRCALKTSENGEIAKCAWDLSLTPVPTANISDHTFSSLEKVVTHELCVCCLPSCAHGQVGRLLTGAGVTIEMICSASQKCSLQLCCSLVYKEPVTSPANFCVQSGNNSGGKKALEPMWSDTLLKAKSLS